MGTLFVGDGGWVYSDAVSEQGWIDFLHAEGVDDWVVLHGGATAAFRVGSLGEAAGLQNTG